MALPESPSAFHQGRFQIVEPNEAKISAFDRSFHFGDSVYEVARTYGGIIFGWKEHMLRMEDSSQIARFRQKPPAAIFESMIRETCQKWFQVYGNHDVYIRWVYSRGISDLNINPELAGDSYGLVFVKELEAPTPSDFERGMSYIVAKRRRNHPDALEPQMKSGNYLNNVLALAEAKALGAQDAIMLSHDGYVTEGTTNNVYTITDGRILTAPVSLGILDGVTRRWLKQAANEESIVFEEKLFTTEELKKADEIFMSSSIKEIQAITKLDGKVVSDGKPGEFTRRVAKRLSKIIQDEIKRSHNVSLFLKG